MAELMAIETVPPAPVVRDPGRGTPRKRRKDGLAALGFLSPAIVAFLIFVLAPTAGVLYLSFYDWNLLSDGAYVGLDNFDRLIHDDRLLGVYGSTAYMALVILMVNVVFGLLLSVLLET